MMDWIEQYWVLIVLCAVVALVLLWWLIGSSTTRSVEAQTRDALEHEVSPRDVVPPILEPVMAPEPERELIAPLVDAGPPDELTRMKGVGPKVAALLNSLGVTRYDQIAAWTDADVARVDAQLGAFKGRVTRDHWVEQAGLLAADDTPGFEAKFGKLG